MSIAATELADGGAWLPTGAPARPSVSIQTAVADGDVEEVKRLLTLYGVVDAGGEPLIPKEGADKWSATSGSGLASPPVVFRTASAEARILEDDERYVQQLIEQERHEQREAEAAYPFTCIICLYQKPVQASFTPECDHRICSECFTDQMTAFVTQGNVAEASLCCGMPDCRRPYTAIAIEQTLRAHGQADLAQRFVDIRTDEGLSADTTNFRRCPHNGCNFLFAWRPGDEKHFECPQCDNSFCLACTAGGGAPTVGPSHFPHNCEQRRAQIERDEDERRLLQEWQENNSRADELFRQHIESDQDTRTCPSCGRTINRSTACDHMTCQCGAEVRQRLLCAPPQPLRGCNSTCSSQHCLWLTRTRTRHACVCVCVAVLHRLWTAATMRRPMSSSAVMSSCAL